MPKVDDIVGYLGSQLMTSSDNFSKHSAILIAAAGVDAL